MLAVAVTIALIADEFFSEPHFSVTNVVRLLTILGPIGLCTCTWWVAGRYFRGKVRLAKEAARQAQQQAEATSRREKTARAELKNKEIELCDAVTSLTEEREKRHCAETKKQQLDHELSVVVPNLASAKKTLLDAQEETEKLYREVSVLRQKTGMTVEELTAKSRMLARLERRMRSALKLEGQLWNAKALQKRPKFRPISQRQRAIISVLNLKGGVGKTTITAHLGKALARRGYRVLLLDLDLQGSLTSTLVPQEKIGQSYADKRLIQHFFQRAVDDQTAKINDYTIEVFRYDNGGLLDITGATDNLAYAELNLTMRWLLGSGDRDTRFLLRKALHLMSVSNEYDIVLIDCPPLVNISCVNALAASDYVLTPTTMSRKSLERVPLLINKVLCNEKFLKFINPKLHLLGLVANRTSRGELTAVETSDWKQVHSWCKDAFGKPVTQFATTIPQIKEVQVSEAEFDSEIGSTRLEALFTQLAAEIEREIPSECRRTAKTPS